MDVYDNANSLKFRLRINLWIRNINQNLVVDIIGGARDIS